MSFPTLKELKKLTADCRKAGISKFKQGDLEITIADEAPVSNYKKTKSVKFMQKSYQDAEIINDKFQSDELSPEALLYWSAGGTPDETEGASE